MSHAAHVPALIAAARVAGWWCWSEMHNYTATTRGWREWLCSRPWLVA